MGLHISGDLFWTYCDIIRYKKVKNHKKSEIDDHVVFDQCPDDPPFADTVPPSPLPLKMCSEPKIFRPKPVFGKKKYDFSGKLRVHYNNAAGKLTKLEL